MSAETGTALRPTLEHVRCRHCATLPSMRATGGSLSRPAATHALRQDAPHHGVLELEGASRASRRLSPCAAGSTTGGRRHQQALLGQLCADPTLSSRVVGHRPVALPAQEKLVKG